MNDKKLNDNKKAVSLISLKEYKERANRSGDPLLISNAENRYYENSRINGTTLIILSALSGSGKKDKKIGIEDFIKGVKALKDNSFNNPIYKNLEKNYRRGDNRSTDPAKKISPVLSALISRGKAGYIKGFNTEGIGDAETRKIFGFNF